MRWIALAAAVVACGRGSSSAVDSNAVNAAGAAPKTTSSIIAKGPPCPATGLWATCSIEQRLKRSGLVAKKIDSAAAPRAGFSVTPVVYALGRDSRLELFIYPSEAALTRDIAKMDTVKVAPTGTIGSWTAPPLLIRSANLAAVLLTHDAREADRLSLALTAGAPQAAR